MTKHPHPANRAERIKLREQKKQEKSVSVDKTRRRIKEAIKQKEAEDELSLAIANIKG